MNKVRTLSLLLACALIIGLLGNWGLSLTAKADDIPDAGTPEKTGLAVKKTATYNEKTDDYTITLEAYATGSKIISSVDKDAPTDIVLVIDQSSSMANCIYCGKSQSGSNQHNHNTYTATTNIDTSKTYYIAEIRWGSTTYTKVSYCNGTHSIGSTSWSCDGGAGWYTQMTSGNHTASSRITPKTTENPNGTQFYTYEQKGFESRLSALKTAVTNFANSVATKAKGADGQYGTDDDVNHRIAIVGFGSDSRHSDNQYVNSELFIGNNYYNYNKSNKSSDGRTLAAAKYSSAFQHMNTSTGVANVKASIEQFAASGGTAIDIGTDMANKVFEAYKNEPGNSDRQKVVVIFTDGLPGIYTSDSDSQKNTYANNAIDDTYISKHTYKATVYTVGVFDGADAENPGNLTSSTSWGSYNDRTREFTANNDVANKYMHLMSSNYLDAKSMTDTGSVNPDLNGDSYYLSAGDSASLDNIFQQISANIESGGSSSTLNASAVIKDIIAPQFQLPEGATAENITLQTATCTGIGDDGEYTWATPTDATDVTARISDDNVDVTGFNFSANWVGTETTDGNTSYHGSKLIISFNVETKDGFLGGNDVYTNTSAGVYKDAEATTPEFTFNRPQVNVPINDVTVTAADKNVYLLGDLSAEQIKSGATVKCGDVSLNLSADNYGLESWQTDYVNITIAYTDASGNTITDLSDLKDDTTYTVTATVSPKTNGSTTDQGKTATEQSGYGTGNINVFKPELTFKDSEVYYGDTAPTDYSGNKTSEVWKHGDTLSTAVTMIGTAPALDLTYTPEDGKIVDNKIATKSDFAVDVAVKINGTDVTNKTSFVHTKCNTNETDPTDGKFWLHVKTCTLTISKAAPQGTTIGDDEYFVFNIKKDGEQYTQVTIKGTGSITISELPVGTYTVVEDGATAWRYTVAYSDSATAVLSKDTTAGRITVTNTLNNNQWLNHFTRVINTFGKAEGEIK